MTAQQIAQKLIETAADSKHTYLVHDTSDEAADICDTLEMAICSTTATTTTIHKIESSALHALPTQSLGQVALEQLVDPIGNLKDIELDERATVILLAESDVIWAALGRSNEINLFKFPAKLDTVSVIPSQEITNPSMDRLGNSALALELPRYTESVRDKACLYSDNSHAVFKMADHASQPIGDAYAWLFDKDAITPEGYRDLSARRVIEMNVLTAPEAETEKRLQVV